MSEISVNILKEDIEKISNYHFDVEPRSIERISTGLFNESYILNFDSPIHVENLNDSVSNLVLRIAPPDDAGFLFYEHRMMRKEPFIHDLLQEKTDIPVPTIILSDFSHELIPRDYLLMEKMDGFPLSESKKRKLKKIHLVNAYYQIGHYIRQAHDIPLEMHGYYGPHDVAPLKDSWFEEFKIMWQFLQEDLVKCGAYTQEESNLFLDALKYHANSFKKEISPSLLHMDVWDQNILVNSVGDITAILDWDRSIGGDPEIDMAIIDYCGLNNPAFWSGYGKELEITNALQVRMKFYLLYEHQKYMVINTYRRPNQEAVMNYKQACLQVLSQLNNMM